MNVVLTVTEDQSIKQVIYGVIIFCSIGYIYNRFLKVPKERFYFRVFYTKPITIEQIVTELEFKNNTLYSWIVDYAIIYHKKQGYLIYWRVFSIMNFINFSDPCEHYRYLTENDALEKFVDQLSEKRALKFFEDLIGSNDIKISSFFLRTKLLIKSQIKVYGPLSEDYE